MQAILTKFLGATNSRGSRIKASCDAGQVTLPYRHELSSEGNHRAAASMLLSKLKWVYPDYPNVFYSGQLDNGTWAHVVAYPSMKTKVFAEGPDV